MAAGGINQAHTFTNPHIAGAGVSPPVTAITHKPARISEKALIATHYGVRS
jgi:hypothetical protein